MAGKRFIIICWMVKSDVQLASEFLPLNFCQVSTGADTRNGIAQPNLPNGVSRKSWDDSKASNVPIARPIPKISTEVILRSLLIQHHNKAPGINCAIIARLSRRELPKETPELAINKEVKVKPKTRYFNKLRVRILLAYEFFSEFSLKFSSTFPMIYHKSS